MSGIVPGDAPGGVPHLMVPVGLAQDGSLATVEQDSLDEITQSVRMLLGTLPGTRLTVPGYGLPDPTFGHVTAPDIEALAAIWESRAGLTVTVTGQGRATTVQVGVTTKETG